MSAWPPETLFVVYCAGPHCNGAARAAVRLSALGRPVKIMIGGITGWLDEAFPLAEGTEDGVRTGAKNDAENDAKDEDGVR